MNKEKRLAYLQAVVDSQLSPTDLMMIEEQKPGSFFHVDVRVAPAQFKGNKVAGSLEIPLPELMNRLDELPKDKTILLCTWGVTCALAKQASILLINEGYDVTELSGGIALWEEFKFPVEPSTHDFSF